MQTDTYYSLKGTQLYAARLGIAFKYCKKCFDDLKFLIKDYIQVESPKGYDKCSCSHESSGYCIFRSKND